ncbi:MAG: DUF1254 domain-containing protein [Promethearchaeota archaeon]|jgi:uncharacterized membrane protein
MIITIIQIIVWFIITLILARVLYIFGITLYTYHLTDKRLKGFPQYRIPNKFLHGPVTSASSRLVPYPTPHAMVSACVYDVHEKSLRIRAKVPDGVYWSIAFSARNQDCYFTINDLEAKQKYGEDIEIVLIKRGVSYKKKKGEIVVSAPRFSNRGLILVRIIMMDPSDKDEVKRIMEIQKMVTTEIFEID